MIEPPEPLVYWRTFDSLAVFRRAGPAMQDTRVDWASYKRERTWWRSIAELQSLLVLGRA